MKRLLSMILAAAMVASMMAPVAYADDTLPITEPTATVQEQPAEDTPAETAPVETPTQEATPAPTETPVEATPAPTAEPTATPEPTEMPTPEPTVEPTAEPTAEPVPTEKPAEIAADVPAEQAAEAAAPTETASPDDADPETTLILYKAATQDYYYGKLPVKVGNTGTNAMPIMEYSTGCQDTPGSTYITVRGDDSDFNIGVAVVFIDGEYWVYAPEQSYPLLSVTYYDPMPNDDGTYNVITLPVQVSETVKYEDPYNLLHHYGQVYAGSLPSGVTAYDKDYRINVGTSDSGYKIVKVFGLNGVEVVSQPDSYGNMYIRYPSGTKYAYVVDGHLRAMAALGFLEQDNNGNFRYGTAMLNKVAGFYEATMYGSPKWGDLLSADGSQIQLAYTDNWSDGGEVQNVKAVLKTNAAESENLSNYLTATYDKEKDVVNVKLSKEPTDIDSATWMLYVTVTYADGTVFYTSRDVQKSQVDTKFVTDKVTIPNRAGNTATGTLYQYNSSTNQYDVPYMAGGDAEVVLDQYPAGLDIAEKAISDYLDVAYDGKTAQVVITVKKDIPLKSGYSNPCFSFTVQTKYATTYNCVVYVGAPSISAYTTPSYFDMCGANGFDLEVCLGNNYQKTGWSALGTPDVATGPSAVLKYTDSDNVKHEAPVMAAYNADKDVVNLKMALSDVPENAVTKTLYVTFPCAEYTLKLETSIAQKYFSVSTANESPSTMGVKAGASMTMDINYYDSKTNSNSAVPDFDWTWSGTCNDGNADFGSDEVTDYVKPEFVEDGQLRFTVIKDVTLTAQRATLQFTATSKVGQFNVSVGVGSPYVYTSSSPSWKKLKSSDGEDVTIYTSGNYNNAGWSTCGTLDTAAGPSAELSYTNADGRVVTVPVQATYKSDTDAVNLKFDCTTLPQGLDYDGSEIKITFPCTEYDLVATTYMYKDWVGANLNNLTGLGALGLKAGATMLGDLTYYDQSTSSQQPLPADGWNLTLSQNDYDSAKIALGDGETLDDYIKAELYADGKVRLTVLKNITLTGSSATTASVTLGGKTQFTQFSVSFNVGTPSVNVNLRTTGSGSATLREGNSFTVEPYVQYNGQQTSFKDLGITNYKYRVMTSTYGWNNIRYLSDEEVAEYFDIAEKDGKATIAVKKVPELYRDTGSDIYSQDNCYVYGFTVESTDGAYVRSSAYYPDLTLNNDGVELELYQDGTRVRTLPKKAGTYTYDIRTKNGRALPTEGKAWVGGNIPNGVTIGIDLATAKLTYTVESDLNDSVTGVYAFGFLGTKLGFGMNSGTGRAMIGLSFFNDEASGASFSKTNNRITVAGYYTNDNVYLAKDALKDEGFTFNVFVNGNAVPIGQCEYIGANVKNGILNITFKKDIPDDVNCSLQVSYKDENYETSYANSLSYSRSSSTTTWYYPIAVNPTTGKQVSVIPNGKAGTTAEYTINASGQTKSLAQLCGDSLTGFTINTNAPINVDDYVTVSFNNVTSKLKFEWKQPLPLIDEQTGIAYGYYLNPQTTGSQSVHISNMSLIKISSDLVMNSADGYGTTFYLELRPGSQNNVFVQGYGNIDEGFTYAVKSADGTPVGEDKIRMDRNDWGGITITVADDVEPQNFSYTLNATLEDGSYAMVVQYGTLYIVGDNKVAYTVQADSFGTRTLNGGNSVSLYGGETMTLRAATDGVKNFTLRNADALSKYINSIRYDNGASTIVWNDAGGQFVMELEATMEDGSKALTTVTVYLSDSSYYNSSLTYWLEGATEAAHLFGESTWTVGKTYKAYPHLGSKTLKEAGYTIKDAWLAANDYYSCTFNAEEGYVLFAPLKAYAVNNNSHSNKYLSFIITIAKDGQEKSFNATLNYGTNVVAGSRSNFVNPDTRNVIQSTTLSAARNSVRLKVNENKDTIQEITYKTNLPESLTWVQDASDPTIVTLTAQHSLPYENAYFAAVITRKDGTQSSAYVTLSWSSRSYSSYLPNGMEVCFGSKGESQDYKTWSGSSAIKNDYVGTNKLYVFFASGNYNSRTYYDTIDNLDSIKVTSSDDKNAQVLRQGREDGTYFFEYQINYNELAEYEFTATVTMKNGQSFKSIYSFRVTEDGATETVRVTNTDELQSALTSATLAPGTWIQVQTGDYEGNFVVDVPGIRLDGNYSSKPNIKGTIRATEKNVEVQNINFTSPVEGSGTAISDVREVRYCEITGYNEGVVMDRNVVNSQSCMAYGNNLTDNNTALVLDGYQRYVYINGNTFLNNKTGVLVAETCNLDGSYSSMYGVKVNGGTTNHNLFYLNAGQIAVSNQPNGDTAANFTYNYFATPKDGKFVDAVPKNDMFEGSVLYVPFYETPEMDTVNTDKSLDDIAKENQEDTTKAKLELAAAQGSSTPGGIDSSLTLSGNKFEELQKESNKAKSMEVTVKSTSNETDVIWDFEKDKLKDDYDGSSVNLGVAFTFTDFEQDIVSNVVTKSKEDGTTLNSIAYQAMCFSHSGDLPGEATVKIRMNESLLDYYSKHNNSLEGFKIYYVNEGTGKLEVMRDASGNPKTLSVEVVDGVYFAVTSIDHCSSYLLTPEDLNEAISGLTKILLNAGAPLTLDELTQPDGAVLRLLSHMEPGVTLNKLAQYLSGGSMTVLDTNGNKVGADAPLGTGYTIGLGADGKTGGVTVAVAGDLNGDGSVDTKDLTMMRQAILQIGQLTQVQLKAATPSTNGSRVDTNDLVLLRRYLLSMTKTMLD